MERKDKMQTEKNIDPLKVMESVSSVVSFMKQQVTSDLVEAKNKGSIELSKEDLRKICFYVETSMTNSFVKAYNQIENSLK